MQYSESVSTASGQTEMHEIGMEEDPNVGHQKERTQDKWTEFISRTTLHGMKVCGYAGDGGERFTVRRVLLLSLVVASVAFFLHQTIVRCSSYAGYPSHVDVQITHQKHLEFPSVTICNQNSFRISPTLELGAHSLVTKLLQFNSDKNIQSCSESNTLESENLTEFVLKSSHLKDDLIYSCTWAGEECDLDKDFTTTMTEFFTLCYTYNWNRTAVKKVYQPGVAFSLRLKLNVESYEYVNAVKNNIGVKVLIHPKSEIPQVGELGFSVPPGTHTLVAVLPVTSEHLPKPWGTCVTDAVPRSKCFADFRKKFLEKKCGCSNIHIDADPNDSLDDRISTAFDLSSTGIECPVPCTRTNYLEEISYARLSRLNVQRFRETEREKYEHLRNKLRKARSASDAINSVTVGKEKGLVRRVLEQGAKYMQSLETLKVVLTGHALFGVLSDRLVNNGKITIPDHRLTTDGKLVDDLKYLIKDYNFKKDLVQKPQPDLYYYTLFVKLIRSFVETDASVVEGQKTKLAFYHNEEEKEEEEEVKEKGRRIFTVDEGEPKNPALLRKSESMESLLAKCALEESAHGNSQHSRAEDDFHSCDDEDMFTYLGMRKIQLRNAEAFESDALNDLRDAVPVRIERAEILFKNTSQDSFLSDRGHSTCLEQTEKVTRAWLDKTGIISRRAIKPYLQSSTNWTVKLDIYHLLSDFVRDLEFSNDSVYNELNFAECDWNFMNDSSLKIKNPFANSDFGFFVSYVEATRSSFDVLNSRASRRELAKKIDLSVDMFALIYKNISIGFEDFLGSNLTRRQLLRYVTEITQAIQPLRALHQDVIQDLTSFLIKLTSFSSNMYQAYNHMIRLPLPVLNDSNVESLSIIRYAKEQLDGDQLDEEKRKELSKLLANVTGDARLGRERSALDLVFLIYSRHETSLERQLHSVKWNFDMFFSSPDSGLSALEKVLVKTSADPDLDENFFRDNMVKLDIFFKDIKLKRVQQKPSTTILALFSELGSGMSLLLGASVLTFCELADFVVLLVASKVGKKFARKK